MNRLHPLSAVVYALQYGFVWLWIPVFLLVVLSGVFDPIRAAWMPLFAVIGFALGIAYGGKGLALRCARRSSESIGSGGMSGFPISPKE